MEMRDCKFGWWKEKGERGRGGGRGRGEVGTGRGEGDSQPSSHEMMRKEVKMLESVENEGPEGLRVKGEQVRMEVSGWGCRGGGLCAHWLRLVCRRVAGAQGPGHVHEASHSDPLCGGTRSWGQTLCHHGEAGQAEL